MRILQEKEEVSWLEFELFQQYPEIAHGVFVKTAACEEGFGGKEMQHDEGIKKNRHKAREAIGLDYLVTSRQCHEDHIALVDDYVDMLPDPSADGLCSSLRGIGLTVYHADCQAVFFYDPTKKVIANIHCGWRGNVCNILGKAVFSLQKRFGCNPKDLLVGISPSLGPRSAQFVHYREEFPEDFHGYQVAPGYFDLWEISYQQLRSAGILDSHIEIARLCTYEDNNYFFSYRRDKTLKRNMSVIGLLPNR